MGGTSSSDMETGEQLCPGKTIWGHWNLDFMLFSPPTEEYFPECLRMLKSFSVCLLWPHVFRGTRCC